VVSIAQLQEGHTDRILKVLDDPDKACHLIFRLLGPIFQKKFSNLKSLHDIPKVFIHGNPHMDNYVRTFTGAGMVDFDRSRIGPYAWDVIRFLSSLGLRSEKKNKVMVSKRTLGSFLDGYISALNNTDIYFTIPTFVKTMVPTEDSMTTKSYLKANRKWAKKMRKNPIKIDDQKIITMLKLYLDSREELSLLKQYKISEAGKSEGSLGKMHYLIALTCINEDEKRDDILIDLKETYQEPDTDLFMSPVEHHGLRMIKASNLYAPGVEQRLGHFTFEDTQFWGREIPAFNAKVKELMNETELQEIASCVGAQLGRAHARSCREATAKDIEKNLRENFELYCQMSEFINREVALGLDYLSKAHSLSQEFFSV
jgi:hypothetical protein